MKFRTHENRILDSAITSIFPLPADPEPARVEGILTGYASALAAIGRPVVAGPGEDDVEAPDVPMEFGGNTVAEIEEQLCQVSAALAHRTEAAVAS